MNTTQLEQLFAEYERAFSEPDIKRNAALFSDTFISAGPKGTIAQSKDEFVKKAGKACEFYKNPGQASAKIVSKKFFPISNEYTMATIHGVLRFKRQEISQLNLMLVTLFMKRITNRRSFFLYPMKMKKKR